jgi:hypothetical protein
MNKNDAYAPILKECRLARIQKFRNFEFHRIDVTDGAISQQKAIIEYQYFL